MLFFGPPGTGKTYSASAVINEFLERNSMLDYVFYNSSDLNHDWLRELSETGHDSHLLRRLKEVDILVIDDLGFRRPTPAYLDFHYSILNTRIVNRKRSLYTTNLRSTEAYDQLGASFGSRLFSGNPLYFSGRDMRMKEQEIS